MAIETLDGLIAALGSTAADRMIIDKASLANTVAGGFFSLFRATGQPAQAAIPGTTPIVTTRTTQGAIGLTNPGVGEQAYIGYMFASNSIAAQGFELHDRLAQSGNLSLALTSAQTLTGHDLSTLGVPAERLGAADYSDVQWWLEVYQDGGGTASNATINVTYDDGTTGNLNVQAVGGTLRAGRMLPLTPLIPVAQQGKKIRGINSVTLSASTGTAGNFGFTATRPRTAIEIAAASQVQTFDWARLGLPVVPADACLMLIVLCVGTGGTGLVRGGGKIIRG